MIPTTDQDPRMTEGYNQAADVAAGVRSPRPGGNPCSTVGNSVRRTTSAAADAVFLNTSGTCISRLGSNKSTNSNISGASVCFGIALETRDDFTRFLSAAAVSSHQEVWPT